MLKTTLFKIARSRAALFFIGFAFEYLSALMPLDKYYENRAVMVFAHPSPAWPLHLLAVPKKRIPSFIHLRLDDPGVSQIALDIFEAIQAVACQNSLDNWSVVINGGAYQDVPQLHFHIASSGDDFPLSMEMAAPPPSGGDRFMLGSALAYPHPTPTSGFHHVIVPQQPMPGLIDFDFSNTDYTIALLDMLRAAQAVISRHSLNAYKLVLNVSSSDLNTGLPFHLLSGAG